MEHKVLGSTGVSVPVIGLGTWRYVGGPEPLRRGIALGANLIDTAERYGTEEAVGRAVEGIRSSVFVATKVRHENLRYEDVLRAADNSLLALGTEWIDLYQIHRPNAEVPIAETMSALDELVDMGKVRYIGVSNFSVVQFQAAQAASRHPIVSNQLRYSLVNRTIEDALLPFCQKHGVTVIAYSPLSRGISNLTGGLSDQALMRIAAAEGRTPAQVALNWCISKPNVIAIPRASTVAHVEDICAACGWRLSEESTAVLEAAYSGPIIRTTTT
jgi:diketogulonate reductase-like aldo/keto reductase